MSLDIHEELIMFWIENIKLYSINTNVFHKTNENSTTRKMCTHLK
jgi:hypothetical protein